MSFANPLRANAEVSVITDPAGLVALTPAWRELWRKCSVATPFQSPDWLLPWWDVFAPGELRVVAVHENGELTAVAPLYRDGSRLLPLGVSLSDYQDVLALDADALPAIAAALAAMRDVESCVFDAVRPGALVLGLQITGFDERMESATPCPFIDLAAAKPVAPSALRHLRTARRRAARRGECVILEGDADNALALVAELKRLNGLRHQDGVFADPRVEAFHAAAMPGLIEQGLVRLYALTIADEMAAVYYGFLHAGRAYAYIGGFDPAFAFESPGTILLGHAIAAAANEGAGMFDFLRGGETYKYDWGARDRFNVRYTLARRHG